MLVFHYCTVVYSNFNTIAGEDIFERFHKALRKESVKNRIHTTIGISQNISTDLQNRSCQIPAVKIETFEQQYYMYRTPTKRESCNHHHAKSGCSLPLLLSCRGFLLLSFRGSISLSRLIETSFPNPQSDLDV